MTLLHFVCLREGRFRPKYSGPQRHLYMSWQVLRSAVYKTMMSGIVVPDNQSGPQDEIFGASNATRILHTSRCGEQTSDLANCVWYCRWLLIANAVVFVYSLLATLVACIAVVARRGPLSYSPSAWLTFIVDFVRPPPFQVLT